MKKSKLLSITSLGLAALLVACTNGEGTSSNTTEVVSTTNTPTSVAPTTTIVPTSTQTTTVSTTTTVTKSQYKVTVVYASTGLPVTGVKVQWCNADGCKLPKAVDENGTATLKYEAGKTFSVHVNDVPTGYTYNAYEVVSNDENMDVTVHVYEVGEKTGEGTRENPYVISTGFYKTTSIPQNNPQYYSVTLGAGTYVIESYAASVDAAIDTALAKIEGNKYVSVSDNEGNDLNFLYQFTVDSESSTIIFAMMNSTNDEAYPFSITKLS